MSGSLAICDVDECLIEKVKDFRFRKNTNNAAIIMKINKETQQIVVEKELENISLDELREELPDRAPRYLVYSYRHAHDDGRVSYPLFFIFSSPAGCRTDLQMMYAGSKCRLDFEIRSVEELTEELLKQKLGYCG
ncbi:glia maturation factor beta isoform X1 [Brachionichthys hirsutus]|uniref:glia maturation factor beta isoform X1 n=1 Tax=Brachionichthys hirsutus TaxID=412623 RepID=UPI003604BD79